MDWKLSNEESRQILDTHINVGMHKAVSYLPIKTVVNRVGLSVDEFMKIAHGKGRDVIVFREDMCCIDSGAIYVVNKEFADLILFNNKNFLISLGLPHNRADFIKMIASKWFDIDHPVMPVIKKLFGDELL
jgi:hypothetical protein